MKKGFTLIELLVVIAIIAILAGAVAPLFFRGKSAPVKPSYSNEEKGYSNVEREKSCYNCGCNK